MTFGAACYACGKTAETADVAACTSRSSPLARNSRQIPRSASRANPAANRPGSPTRSWSCSCQWISSATCSGDRRRTAKLRYTSAPSSRSAQGGPRRHRRGHQNDARRRYTVFSGSLIVTTVDASTMTTTHTPSGDDLASRRANWLSLPARNWLCFFARSQAGNPGLRKQDHQRYGGIQNLAQRSSFARFGAQPDWLKRLFPALLASITSTEASTNGSTAAPTSPTWPPKRRPTA